MAYFVVGDFSSGIDLRKSGVTSTPGALKTLTNATITAGGEIRKRKKIAALTTLPAGTFGLGFTQGKLLVFGLAATRPAGLSANIEYAQLIVTGAVSLVHVHDFQVYGTGYYVIAEFSDNSYRHFYNGVQLTGVAGKNIKPHKRKMYATDGVNLRFSAINDPADWVGTGSGIIDVTTEDTGIDDLVGMDVYYGSLALFGRTSIQLWNMDVDPALNAQQQVLGNIGLVAPNALARYANGDVLFLSHTGIRSLRSRDSSGAAVLNDIGSPVDELILAKRRLLTEQGARDIQGLVDPLSGNFWLIWGDEAVVLSLYPNSKVAAWSTLKFPGNINHAVLANSRLAFRRGDEVYTYGALKNGSQNPFDPNVPLPTSEEDYDSTEVEVETHFINMGKPATKKHWTGIDIACEGIWDVYVATDINAPEVWIKVATVYRSTYEDGRIPFTDTSTHIALKLISRGTGLDRLASVTIHFAGEGEAS